MAQSVNIYEAKTHLSSLIARVEAGEEITLSRNGRPVARIVQITPEAEERVPGAWRGKVTLPASFDEFTPKDDADWYRA